MSMKKVLCGLLMLVNFGFVEAQNIVTDTSVTCIAYWKRNDKKDLTVTITTKMSNKGIVSRELSDSYQVSVRIIDSTEKNYTIEWINTGTKSDVNNINLDGITAHFTGMKIIYKTDETGAFQGLVNYGEIQQHVNNTFDELKKKSSGNKVYDSMIQKVKPFFQSRESIEQLIIRDIALFHSAFGAEYSFGKNQQFETELPNFLGGDPFPALLTLYLVKKDKQKDVATVAFDMELDMEKSLDLIKDLLKKSTPPGTKVDEKTIPTYLVISDYNVFDLILSTGWIKRAYMKRIAKSGDFEKVQILEIIQK